MLRQTAAATAAFADVQSYETWKRTQEGAIERRRGRPSKIRAMESRSRPDQSESRGWKKESSINYNFRHTKNMFVFISFASSSFSASFSSICIFMRHKRAAKRVAADTTEIYGRSPHHVIWFWIWATVPNWCWMEALDVDLCAQRNFFIRRKKCSKLQRQERTFSM